jgi:hypothetical protein
MASIQYNMNDMQLGNNTSSHHSTERIISLNVHSRVVGHMNTDVHPITHIEGKGKNIEKQRPMIIWPRILPSGQYTQLSGLQTIRTITPSHLKHREGNGPKSTSMSSRSSMRGSSWNHPNYPFWSLDNPFTMKVTF